MGTKISRLLIRWVWWRGRSPQLAAHRDKDESGDRAHANARDLHFCPDRGLERASKGRPPSRVYRAAAHGSGPGSAVLARYSVTSHKYVETACNLDPRSASQSWLSRTVGADESNDGSRTYRCDQREVTRCRYRAVTCQRCRLALSYRVWRSSRTALLSLPPSVPPRHLAHPAACRRDASTVAIAGCSPTCRGRVGRYPSSSKFAACDAPPRPAAGGCSPSGSTTSRMLARAARFV